MGKSNSRDIYYATNIEPIEEPVLFLKALQDSPFRKHKMIAKKLQEEINLEDPNRTNLNGNPN